MNNWIKITQDEIDRHDVELFLREAVELFGRATVTVEDADLEDLLEIEDAIDAIQERASKLRNPEERLWSEAVAGVLGDLIQQGWTLKFSKHHLWGQRPLDGMARDVLRQRLLVRRDEQLLKTSVREFVQKMEGWRLFRGQRTSIVSLMRDGQLLAEELRAGKPLAELVDPYIQFVTSDGRCDLTGLRTQDIWRYFRHTWSSPYESVPGRSLQFLVRDRAAPFHPVIGIAALSSAAVRLGPRDRFIGWDTDQTIENLLAKGHESALCWCQRIVENAIKEIHLVDLVRDNVISADPSQWTNEAAVACAQASAKAKEQHHRWMQAKQYKANDDVSTEEKCIARAEMYLFRAKRAAELSKLIPILLQLRSGLPDGPNGRDVLSKIIRIARSKTVGTEIADLTVCGAVAPYSHLAAGKLIGMLAVTPEVIAEYKRRYENVPGIIASSMAGRPIRRQANLCYVGTTSLYGHRPSQYDRLSIPAGLVGGSADGCIRYEHIHDKQAPGAKSAKTKGIGTFHFSSRTLKGLELFVSSRKGGWKVNNLFGEGTSPKLRGLRDGLIELGLNADELLVHGMERCMYGVKLAKNLNRYLLGMDENPDWIFNCDNPAAPEVAQWWVKRWGDARAKRTDVLDLIEHEGLAYPIRHRARVTLPYKESAQAVMF
jgi:hypothetical protein